VVTFSILLHKTDGLFGCWYLSAFDRPPDNVIYLIMTLVPGATPSAAQSMKSAGIHCFATWAGVRFAGFVPQSMCNRNPDSFIRQPLKLWVVHAANLQREGMQQPIAWLCQRHQPLLRIPGLRGFCY